MKIRGGRDYIKFDLENGYIVKAEGEMLIGGKFVVYKNTMKAWESPYENEEFCEKDIEGIIAEVQRITTKDTVQLVFE